MNENISISVVVPLYNEEESLPELCEWIARIMSENQYTYEVLLIDDGSTDASWEKINKLFGSNPQIKGIQFNRNYGKSAALDIGFKAAKGEVVITMDADLQDSPEEIPKLYRMIKEEAYDLVSGWKKTRHDPISKTIPSKFFNYITSIISGIKLHDFNCGLKAYNTKVVKAISVYGEMHRYLPVIAKWHGFTKIGEQVVAHQARKYGVTKFGLERFVHGFLDLISISFVSRFRKKPMHFFGTLGTLSFLFGFVFTVKIFWNKIDSIYISKIPLKRNITEQPLFYLALVASLIGVQLFLAGFIAEMIAINSSHTNEYLVSKRVGIDEES